jgi:hypothetical protein
METIKRTVEIPEPSKSETAAVQKPAFQHVTCAAEAQLAADFATLCASKIKKIKAYFKDSKEMAHRLHKDICYKEAALCLPFEQGEKWAKTELNRWTTHERQRREAEQARHDALAREEAAKKARQDNKLRLAKQIEDGKVAVVGSKVVDTPIHIDGYSTREVYDVEVVEPMKVLKGIVDGRYPIGWVTFDMKALREIVNRTQGIFLIEGCSITKETVGRRTR